MKTLVTIILFALIAVHNANAACLIHHSDGTLARNLSDALSILLKDQASCPKNVFELRKLIKNSNLKLASTMVANRGFHNPQLGSFSIFEIVTGKLKNNLTIRPGDFFFGHFTTVDRNNRLELNQRPDFDALMVELIAWDYKKALFNFYELLGDGHKGEWFYRGDSLDILKDNAFLHRDAKDGQPKFGERLRCSACHDLGGPIMKELAPPHNDWWEEARKLDFDGRTFNQELSGVTKTLVPANYLANSVKQGIKKLNHSPTYQQYLSSQSLQEELRPLFCPVELNIESDHFPNDANHERITIPLAFFIDSRLIADHTNRVITIARSHYERALISLGLYFPETNLLDADHAWLTPVKAEADKIAIESAIERGVIDRKFEADVLAIDMTHPVFSKARCALLKYLPNKRSENWRDDFINNLLQADDKAAQTLAINLKNPNLTLEVYQDKAECLLEHYQLALNDYKAVYDLVRRLIKEREAISLSDISANPKGKILEPGFRVIFPTRL